MSLSASEESTKQKQAEVSFSPLWATSSIYLRSMIITHYCRSLEEALKKARIAAKKPGYDYWGKAFPVRGAS